MGDMLFEGVGVDEDVVKVNNAEKVEIIVEAIVSISLHRGRGIGKAERHDKILEVSITGSKCCFPFIAEGDMELIESIP